MCVKVFSGLPSPSLITRMLLSLAEFLISIAFTLYFDCDFPGLFVYLLALASVVAFVL